MSAGLDTSVTLRLLTGVPTEQATAAREFVAASPSPVVISDLVIAETYFALRHHYEVPHADAVRTLLALVSDSHFRTTGVARAVLADASKMCIRDSFFLPMKACDDAGTDKSSFAHAIMTFRSRAGRHA